MTTSLTTLRTRVRSYAGRPSTDSFYTDAVLNTFLNAGLQAYSIEDEWPWLVKIATPISTVAGTDTYSVPTDWIATKVVQPDQDDALELMPLEEMLSITAQGKPVVYKIEAGSILLRPIPDSVYTINHYYYATEPALSADNSTPLIPDAFVEAVVHFALAEVYGREGQVQEANDAFKEYQEWLERMRKYKRRSDGALRPRIRPGSQL